MIILKDKKNEDVVRKEIFDFCKDKIAFYKIPKFIKFVESYPMTVSGKVQKFVIRN